MKATTFLYIGQVVITTSLVWVLVTEDPSKSTPHAPEEVPCLVINSTGTLLLLDRYVECDTVTLQVTRAGMPRLASPPLLHLWHLIATLAERQISQSPMPGRAGLWNRGRGSALWSGLALASGRAGAGCWLARRWNLRPRPASPPGGNGLAPAASGSGVPVGSPSAGWLARSAAVARATGFAGARVGIVVRSVGPVLEREQDRFGLG